MVIKLKKKYLIHLLFAIILGFISAQIVYSNYSDNIFELEYNSYFLSIQDNSDDALMVFDENGNSNYYVGITTSMENANKIKKIYENKNININIEPQKIDNDEFLSNLEQYDILISSVNSDESIISINEVVLSSYDEIVLGN